MSYDTRIQEVAHALTRGQVRLFSVPGMEPSYAIYSGGRAVIFHTKTLEVQIVQNVVRCDGYSVDARTTEDVRERARRVLLLTMLSAVAEQSRVDPNSSGPIVPLHE